MAEKATEYNRDEIKYGGGRRLPERALKKHGGGIILQDQMKKILFIEPPPTLDWTIDSRVSKAGRRHPCLNETGEQVYSYQNLSCAAVLRAGGNHVGYLHCPTERLDLPMTKAEIDKRKPDAIVIMVEHINAPVAWEISRHAKDNGVTVVWVGPFVTSLHENEIRRACAGYILRKEWDYSVGELLAALEGRKDIASVNGLTWKDAQGVVRINPDTEPIADLDNLPIPAYDLLDLSKFYESVFVAFPAATMITSRGCPFNCIFCSYPQTIYGHKFRAMSPQRVVREIEYLVTGLGVREIRIDDDTFNVDRQRVIDICKLMVAKKIRVVYSVQARAQLMTGEMAYWLKKSGCRMVLYGVESGSEEVLRHMRKNTTKDEIRRGVAIAKKHGIDVLNCIMLGFYWDTEETMEESMRFAFELNAEFTQVSAPTPLPGTDYYKLLKDNNCLLTEEWDKHDSVHHSAVTLPKLSNDVINRYLSAFYRRYYRRPRYLLMMALRSLRSWGNFRQSIRKFGVLFTK
jgi:anaerobic magnesium-protoporphyrin IX monomethyl ester cyclase